MKRKCITSLSIAVTALSLLTACGSSKDVQMSAMATSEIPVETSATMETEITVTTETEEAAATETPTTVETETATAETETATETEKATTETKTQSKTDTTATDNASADTFTVTPLNQTMYTQKACNVREKPSTDYGVIFYLDKAAEVKVTGKVNEVNWYEVSINDEKGYISAGLLSDTKPAEQQATPNTNTDTPAQTSPPASTPNTDGYTPNGDGTYTNKYGDIYGIDSTGHMAPINPDTGKPYEDGERTQNGWYYGGYNPDVDF